MLTRKLCPMDNSLCLDSPSLCDLTICDTRRAPGHVTLFSPLSIDIWHDYKRERDCKSKLLEQCNKPGHWVRMIGGDSTRRLQAATRPPPDVVQQTKSERSPTGGACYSEGVYDTY